MVGGGPAGIAAAVAGARNGARTMLVVPVPELQSLLIRRGAYLGDRIVEKVEALKN